MPKATPEEIDLLAQNFPKFVDETRKNFGAVNDSLNTYGEKLDELYRLLGKNGTETHLLAKNVGDATAAVKNHTQEIKESHEELQETINGSTKVVIKEVEKAKKKWFMFWKKKGG